MNRDWNAEIDRIIKDTVIDKGFKIPQFYAIAMLNYRQPVGDRALDEIGNIIGKENVGGFMFLTGFLVAGKHKDEDWLRLGRFTNEF